MELAAIVGMCGLSLALGVGGTRAIFGAMFLMMPARASEDSLSAPSAWTPPQRQARTIGSSSA